MDPSQAPHSEAPRRRRNRSRQAELLALDREERAIAMARRGMMPHQIARELAYRSRSGAARAIQRAVARHLDVLGQAAAHYRHLQYLGLQDLKMRLWVTLQGRPVVDPQGRPIMDPQTERPLYHPVEPDVLNETARTLIRLFAREARLLGLDLQTVPTQIPPSEGEGGLRTAEVDGEIITIEVDASYADELTRSP